MVTRKLLDRSAWHHADGWRLYGVSGVRSNTIRRTRPDVSAMKHPAVKGVRPSHGRFHRCANRLKGYVRGELLENREVTIHTSGRTLRARSGRVRGIDDLC
ncbi:hypothetical protein GCM10023086_73760 [Streptomyces venetus]|uniref:Uncharacterized protein n=1 Tax=Streptomyces venetus TaxID=1701086 RepID=A0ABP8HGS8_9ACTN